MARGASTLSLSSRQNVSPPPPPPPPAGSGPATLLASPPSSPYMPPPLPSHPTTITFNSIASIAIQEHPTTLLSQHRVPAYEPGLATPRPSSQQTALPTAVATAQVFPASEHGVGMSVQNSQTGYFPETITAPSSISIPSGASVATPIQTGTLPQSPNPDVPAVCGWGKFFTEDMKATPVFRHFMEAIFSYLDTRRTGTLTPEVYSRFLMNQGYVGQENIWNANLVESFGQTKEDVADAALKRNFDLFGIEYILGVRDRANTPAADTVKRQFKSVARAITPSASGGMMPLLTRQGFMCITALEALCNPVRHWGSLACIIKIYDLPEVREWGDLPQYVLPSEADPWILASVAEAREQAKDKDKGQIRRAAGYAKSTLNKIDTGAAASYAARQLKKVNAKDVASVAAFVLLGLPPGCTRPTRPTHKHPEHSGPSAVHSMESTAPSETASTFRTLDASPQWRGGAI
ncbi:hypothetical protein B0H19DRAFT_1068189 [Mycena capillaripes]|nr:hypothetical protein B0H19DRAFT_1068189 [Mycena capillaripes]